MSCRAVVVGLALTACGRIDFAPRTDAGLDGDGDVTGDAVLPAEVRTLAVGRGHGCAIRDGVLACWGNNTSGQVGIGVAGASLVGVFVEPTRRWVAVTAGDRHTCAVDDTGRLWCWGNNDNGRLGTGDLLERRTPMVILTPGPVRAIDSVFDHTCAILDNGALACWGKNNEGQLGTGDLMDRLSPTLVSSGEPWTAVAPGQGHTIAVRGGEVTGTGRNSDDELGLGASAPTQIRTMQVIESGAYLRLTAGQQGTCGVLAGGATRCWGLNDLNDLGLGDAAPRPTPVDGPSDVLDYEVNTFHGCAIATSGALTCWGRNAEGQLGIGDTSFRAGPVATSAFTDWVDVEAGRFHTCAMRADGSVWCTGENSDAQLGTGDTDRRDVWTEVILP